MLQNAFGIFTQHIHSSKGKILFNVYYSIENSPPFYPTLANAKQI